MRQPQVRRGGELKPYYDHAGITIYHGDCREVLPEIEPVDLVLTDPPYGIGVNTDNSRFRRGHVCRHAPQSVGTGGGQPVTGDNRPFDPSFLLRLGTSQIVWGWNNFPDKLPGGSCLVWLKRNDSAFGSFLSDAELAWKSDGHGVYCRRDLSLNAITADRAHPTQKPLSLMRWCLDFYPKHRTVLDPFMGSGTTLVAAKDLGRRAIGIEIEERYCEIAAKRLSQEVLPL
jgi:DNA modification methylase